MSGDFAAQRRVTVPRPDQTAQTRAVEEARQWLAEKGVAAALDTGSVDPAPQVVADAPGTPGGSRAAAAPGAGAARSSTRDAAPRRGRTRVEKDSPDADDPDPDDPDAELHADPEGVARTIVLRKLATKARTRHELQQALQARNVPTQAAETVLDRMAEVGLIDDEAFAADWVESRQQRRHLSVTALRQELRSKGIDRDQIDAALDQVDASAEFEAALALAERKAATMSALPREVRYRRLAGVLTRRGFGSGVTTQVLSQVLAGR